MSELFLAAVLAWSIPSALAARWLADEKGHEPNYWTVVGLLFGPLAVLTVGLAPRGLVGFKPCVECYEAIHPLATKCPHCGSDLIGEDESEVER